MEPAREEHGGRALLTAISKGQLHLARFLLEAADGSLLESRDPGARTPLMYSVLQPAPATRARFMRLLLERGARVDSSERTGRTALSLACELGFLDAVKLLVQSSADPELADHRGNTPLLYAAASGHRDVIAFLLRAFKRLGLDIERPNRAGHTAGQVARLLGHRDCALALEAAARRGRVRGQLPPDEPAGHPSGHSLDHPSGHSSGHSSGHTPGHPLGHLTGHSSGHPPGQSSGHLPSHTPGHHPGHSSDHSSGHSPGQTPGHPPGHSSGHSSDQPPGHSPGHSSGHSTGHSPGHFLSHCPGDSPGHPLGHSLDHLLGHSPGDCPRQCLEHLPGHSRTPLALDMDKAPFRTGRDAMGSIDEERAQDEDEDLAQDQPPSHWKHRSPQLCSHSLQDGGDSCTSLLPPLSGFSKICTVRTPTLYSPRPAKSETETRRQRAAAWTRANPEMSTSAERGSAAQGRDSRELTSYFQKRFSLPTRALAPYPPEKHLPSSKAKDSPSTSYATFTVLGNTLFRRFTFPNFETCNKHQGTQPACRMPRSQTFPIRKDHPQISNKPSIDSISAVHCEFPFLNKS